MVVENLIIFGKKQKIYSGWQHAFIQTTRNVFSENVTHFSKNKVVMFGILQIKKYSLFDGSGHKYIRILS